MSFSLPRFLRRVQPSDLQGHFGARAILFSEQVDWMAKSAALAESVKTAIEVLPKRERERVFEDFERIGQVSDEIGQRALRSFIEQDEALLRRLGKSSIIPSTSRDCPSAASNSIVKNQGAEQDGR